MKKFYKEWGNFIVFLVAAFVVLLSTTAYIVFTGGLSRIVHLIWFGN
ncbi:hypothetical protein [Lactococcus petauri]|nr:hypothetical protein [Lactococcus petauri]